MNKYIELLKKKNTLIDLALSKYDQRIPNPDHFEIIKRVPNAHLFLKSFINSLKYNDSFKNINTFCLFLGYSRSGHSLVGSLLDAHPNVIIGHEVDVLYLSQKGYSRDQILSIILENSKIFAKVGRGWSGYSYEVKNQWQGKFNKLLVIGDKMGGWTSYQILNNEHILDAFKAKIHMGIKYIHHIRNPFDIISRSAIKKGKTEIIKSDIDSFLLIAKAISETKKNILKNDILEEEHEDFIVNPEKYLRDICFFLNIQPNENYLNACSKTVNPKIKKSRYEIIWSKQLIKYLSKKLQSYPYLSDYSYYK